MPQTILPPREGERPFVLEERCGRLRSMAMAPQRAPDRFRAKLSGAPPATDPPEEAVALLRDALPDPTPTTSACSAGRQGWAASAARG